MIKVYCDSGAYRRELSALEGYGLISVHQFKYENKNRKIKNTAPPSNPSWKEDQSTWKENPHLTWEDYGKQSIKWNEIICLIGPQNERDAKHLDSAYMEGCLVFLTSDKDDIASRAIAIYELLGISVFHYREDWEAFLALVQK